MGIHELRIDEQLIKFKHVRELSFEIADIDQFRY